MTAIDILVGIKYGAGRHIPAITNLRSLYIVGNTGEVSADGVRCAFQVADNKRNLTGLHHC